MIEIIDTEEKLKNLEQSWRELEIGSKMRIFQTFDWCFNAWNECLRSVRGNRLWILRWYQEGRKEQMIAPFYISSKGVLRFIMDTDSDVLNVIYSRECNYHYAFKEIADAIAENKDIKSVRFQKMNGDSLALGYLGVLLPGAFIYRDAAYSWLTVEKTDNFIGALTHMRQKDRSRLKALDKKGSGFEFRIFSKEKGDLFPRVAIIKLREKLLKLTSRTNEFLPDKVISFIEKIYDTNKCEIPALLENGNVKALAFRLLHNNRILHWIVLYDNHLLTTELYVKYMSKKVLETSQVFDFGIGVYDYKLGTFRPELGELFSLMYSKGCCFTQLKNMLIMNWRVVKDFLKAKGFSRH